MRLIIATAACFTVVFGLGISPVWAATHGHAAAGKAAPSCAALAFRPVPAGASDGEQTAGMYRSRFARLELRATLQNGAAANYYIVSGGTRLAAAPAVPPAVGNCANAKKMPNPQG